MFNSLLRSALTATHRPSIASLATLSPISTSLMSAPSYRPRGGGGGRGRGGRGFAGGARPQKRKASENQGLRQAATPGDATPVIPSGVMTPIPSAASQAKTNVRFADLKGLNPELLANIPFEFCTEVQAATLPSIIDNRDVLAQAKTGTGKTVAFLVPSIQRMMAKPYPLQQHTSILVLSPTRELAQQIAVEARRLLGPSGKFGVQSVVGGTSISKDVKNLRSQRADILIATPGRLVDLLENEGLKPRFAKLATLVLDEADRLLDQGFRRELVKILESLPPREATNRQTLLFSATVPAEVHSISSIALNPDHEFISTLKDEDINAHEHVIQESLIVKPNDIVAATMEVLRREESLTAERGGFKVMAFLPTARAAGVFHDIFKQLKLNYPVWEIHSRMSQPKRMKATEEFRASPTGVLFSSDVTARGIDVQGVTGVVQVGLPSSGEQYVHRLGRTARAGAKGHGVLVLADFESFFLRDPTIKTFDLKKYPTLSDSALSQAHEAAARALDKVDEESKGQAYSAWLGYYKGTLKKAGWSTAELVQHANDYARYVLHTKSAGQNWTPPPMQPKTVGKMGLKGVPGLNILRGDALQALIADKQAKNPRGSPKPKPDQQQQQGKPQGSLLDRMDGQSQGGPRRGGGFGFGGGRGGGRGGRGGRGGPY